MKDDSIFFTIWITGFVILLIPATITMWRIFRKIQPTQYTGNTRARRDAPHADDLALGLIFAMCWPASILVGLGFLIFRAATNFGYNKNPDSGDGEP